MPTVGTDTLSRTAPMPIQRLDRWIGTFVEVVVASLFVVEIVLLLFGVVARYVFHSPIVWSDEMAGSIFLWMGMLGAVIALRRGEHLRFGALATLVGPNTRVMIQTLISMFIVFFLCLMLQPAWDYVEDETFAILPNLNVPASWRVSGIALGIVLMLVSAVLQLAQRAPVLVGILCAVLLAVLTGLLFFAAPWIKSIGNFNLFVFFVVLVGAAILVGVPIGFAFGMATLAYLGLATSVPLSVIINRLDQGMSQPLLLAIPMFVFLGLLIDVAGLAKAMINVLAMLLGTIRGGLYYVLLVAMILVSGISGSKVADMAAIAPGLFPEMRRRGAKDGDLVALLASSAAMADTIPPSLVLIAFGSVTGVSIASLFAAGLVPALVLAVVLAILVFIRTRHDELQAGERPDRRVVFRALMVALPALILPFVIRWAVVDGVATATEVSTIGIFYAFVAGIVVYRPMPWDRMYPVLLNAASLSGAILFVIGTATGMSWALTQSGFSSDLTWAIEKFSGNAYGFIAILIVAFVLLGNILEGIPAILLFAPLLLPVSQSFGIHDVHFSMIVVIAMSVGLFAPPFGVGFYAACAIGGVPPDVAARDLWRYLGALMIGLVVVGIVPWFSTALLP